MIIWQGVRFVKTFSGYYIAFPTYIQSMLLFEKNKAKWECLFQFFWFQLLTHENRHRRLQKITETRKEIVPHALEIILPRALAFFHVIVCVGVTEETEYMLKWNKIRGRNISKARGMVTKMWLYLLCFSDQEEEYDPYYYDPDNLAELLSKEWGGSLTRMHSLSCYICLTK